MSLKNNIKNSNTKQMRMNAASTTGSNQFTTKMLMVTNSSSRVYAIIPEMEN